MKILMFSADPTTLDKESSAAKRMIEYGRRVEKLDILVLTPHLDIRCPSGVELACNTKAHALTGKFARFLKAVFNKIRVMLAKFLIPRAFCVRAVSERIKNSIKNEFNLEAKLPSIVVLPILPVLMDLTAEPKRFSEFAKTILMVSRLTSEKNVGLAIDAMAEVIKKHPKIGLVIVGDGPEREALKLQTTNYKLQTNVKFVGWQTDVTSYYKGADIFLLTSLYEGWGMGVVDAMRYGTAI